MTLSKFQAVKQNFEAACKRFEEVLQQTKTEYIRDASIKRFEIVFDLSWKLIKACLEEQGIHCASPLGCFKEGYRQNILDYEEIWVEMVATRNKTIHTYKEALAEKVYTDLPRALAAFQSLARSMKENGKA